MDPDPNGLNNKRKQQRIGIGAISSATDSSNGDAKKPSVKYPSDGWSTSLENMPLFTRAETNEHIARSGKGISDIHIYSQERLDFTTTFQPSCSKFASIPSLKRRLPRIYVKKRTTFWSSRVHLSFKDGTKKKAAKT